MNTENNTTDFESYTQASLNLTTAICAFEQLLDVISPEDPYQPLMEVHCRAISAAHQSLLSCFSYRFEQTYQLLDRTSQNGTQCDFRPFQVISGDDPVNYVETD